MKYALRALKTYVETEKFEKCTYFEEFKYSIYYS